MISLRFMPKYAAQKESDRKITVTVVIAKKA